MCFVIFVVLLAVLDWLADVAFKYSFRGYYAYWAQRAQEARVRQKENAKSA